MLDIIKNLKNTEKKAERIIEDGHKKSEDLIKEAKQSLDTDLNNLRKRYDELHKDSLEKAKKELDAEIRKIEERCAKDADSLKSKSKSNISKINEEITKTLFK